MFRPADVPAALLGPAVSIAIAVVVALSAALVAVTPAAAQQDPAFEPRVEAPELETLEDRAPTMESRIEELESELARLTSRLEEAEAGDGKPADGVCFTEREDALVLERGESKIEVSRSGVTISGVAVSLDARANAAVRAEGVLELDGTMVQINGGGMPVARQGDPVAVPRHGGVGTISTGSATVTVP